MSTPVKPIPDGFHSLTPYLVVKGGAQAIEFYKKAFGAKERFQLAGPDGKTIGHAELVIGNSILMLSDEFPGCSSSSPLSLKGTPVSLVLYVEDVDSSFQRAVDAGGTVKRPLQDYFYGDRGGTIADPFGHEWHLMTHKEDVSPEEMKKRLPAEYEKMAKAQKK